MLLRLNSVTKTFNGTSALAGVSFQVATNEIVGIIGPNGSGKTTIFNLVSRLISPDSGTLFLEDEDLLQLPAYMVARIGVARIFQTPHLASNLTVRQNVAVGAYMHDRWSWPLGIRMPLNAKVIECLGFLDLLDVKDEFPERISYCDRRKTEVARALASSPKLLLLDEPTSGFSQAERDSLARLILTIRDYGVTIILIEHDLSLIRRISNRVLVFDAGQKIAEGSPDVIAADRLL